MYASQWWKVQCPHCQAQNWLDNGDVSDQTVGDVISFQCWKCQKIVGLDDEVDAEEAFDWAEEGERFTSTKKLIDWLEGLLKDKADTTALTLDEAIATTAQRTLLEQLIKGLDLL